MTLIQKAVLLNTLVFPGIGHFFLKHKLIGFIYATISLLALTVVFIKIISLAKSIVDKLNESLLTGETMSLMGILGKSYSESNTQLMNIAFCIYMAIWVIAIVDTFRIGKRLDGK